MIFRRIHVDGFGIWHDLDLDGLGAGLNVFIAPNEGGKSTLMAFVRAVLFGFKRRNDPMRYEPLRGGTHGGWLDVVAEGERYRIQRTDDGTSRGGVEVSSADGRRFPEAKLHSLLRNTTETLYENVFAFGLDELQRLDTLHAEDVAGHIYSAGMTGGAMDPVQFRTQVQDAMDELYRPRGKTQPIAELLGQIEAQEETIERLRERPERHAELLRRQERMRDKLDDVDRRLERRQEEYDRLVRAHRAWSQYEALLSAESTMETIGIAPTAVEEQVIARQMQRAEAEDAAAEARARAAGGGEGGGGGGAAVGVDEMARAAEAAARAAESVDAVELMTAAQRALLRHANKIRGLVSQAERLEELRGTVLERQKEARALRHALYAELEDFGEGWTLERIRGVRTDVGVRDEIRRHAERLRKAEAEIEASAERAGEANLVYEAISENREQISRSTLVVCWGLILLSVVLTAVLVPPPGRFVSTVSIVSVGLLLGSLLTWLHVRGLGQRRDEQAMAARREAELWEQHEEDKSEYERVRREWQGWLDGQDLPTDLSTDGALDLLDRVREAQEQDADANEGEAQVDAAKAELQQCCMNVLLVLEELDRDPVDLKYDALKMVDPLLSTTDELQSDLDAVEEHRERLRRVLDDHAQARAALRALAAEEGYDDFRERLASWDPERLARAVGKAQGQLADVRSDRDAIHENLGALREQIDNLENDAELADRLISREGQRAALAEKVEEWATYAVLGALYDEAKRKYEAERQPEVLRLASRYLEMMTHGRYDRVIAPLGESRLEIERAGGGERLAPEALSRGTGEQLYLAMRLALAHVYGNQAVPLPLVADDILVNFDDDRARATAALLDTYAAEGHQILAFTCHRHLVETFERHAPRAKLSHLPAHS